MSEGTIRCPACGAELPENFKFCAECGHKLTTAARAPEARAPEVRASAVRVSAAPPVEAAPDERRDVTVLFADVSGFTAMSERLDPETVHRMIDRKSTRLNSSP